MTPRVTAATAGLKRYQAKACKVCTGTEHYTSSGACVACVNRKANFRLRKLRALLKTNQRSET